MAGPIDSLRGMFVRPPAARPALSRVELPSNVVPLRPDARLPSAPRAPQCSRGPEPGASVAAAAAPLVVVAGLAGLPEHWLAMAIAGALRDRLGSRCAFLVDPEFVRESQTQSRLRLGAGGILLPFAVRRNGSRLMTIGEHAAVGHAGFLRAIGPLVWSLGGADEHRDRLCEVATQADLLVLARPAEVDAAYCAIVGDELSAKCGIRNVRRVLCGSSRPDECEPADGELVVPASNLDRWRIERGLGRAGAVGHAVEEMVGML